MTPGAAARQAIHLSRRFLGSLRPGGPDSSDDLWARDQLLPGEQELWAAMPGADRRHAVGVARRVRHRLDGAASRPVLAAALLHDVGKIASGLGTPGRVAATLAGMAGGRGRAGVWAARRGPQGRVGRYLLHPKIGADLLSEAGADPLTVAWAAEHHLPSTRWSVPPEVGAALKEADDD